MTKEDLERIDLNVAVAEVTRFPVTEGYLTRIDQSALLLRVTTVPDTEEHKAEMALNVDLASFSSIDCSDDVDDEPTDWKELREKHNAYVRNRDHQIGDQHRHQNRDHHTDDEQNGDQQNRDRKNDDQQNKDDNKVNQHVGDQQNGDQPALPDDNDRFNFKDGDDTEMSQMDMSATA